MWYLPKNAKSIYSRIIYYLLKPAIYQNSTICYFQYMLSSRYLKWMYSVFFCLCFCFVYPWSLHSLLKMTKIDIFKECTYTLFTTVNCVNWRLPNSYLQQYILLCNNTVHYSGDMIRGNITSAHLQWPV